jgi:hypothetical protein
MKKIEKAQPIGRAIGNPLTNNCFDLDGIGV